MTTPVWRHMLAVLLLPVAVLVVVPRWLRVALTHLDTQWTSPVAALAGRMVACGILATGLALFSWCVVLLARVGQGTLAPWDPTRRLVVAGPYRYVRNPMISAVAVLLAGEALFLGSVVLATWCAVFILVNHAYFLNSEEPGLERRFGPAYLEYKRQVPRWIPHVRLGANGGNGDA